MGRFLKQSPTTVKLPLYIKWWQTIGCVFVASGVDEYSDMQITLKIPEHSLTKDVKTGFTETSVVFVNNPIKH